MTTMTEPPSAREIIELVDAIWGSFDSSVALRDQRLRTLIGDRWAKVPLTRTKGYFSVIADETSSTTRLNSRPISLKVIAKLVKILKSNPQLLRKDLECNEDVRGVLEDALLDRAMTIMLMTESSFSGTSHQAIFHPRWKSNESLESFISRVYPENPRIHSDDHSPIQSTKLSVSYLSRRHVQIKVVWTRFLTDHLILSEKNKTLHVFGYPGFLQTTLDAMPSGHADDSVASALRRYHEAVYHTLNEFEADDHLRGCLPHRLLQETMWTYDFLFPIGDQQAQMWLSKQVRSHSLDTMLSRRMANPRIHESPCDIGAPRDVSGLCSKYPYWGQRLYDLWREANDPSPVESRLEEFASLFYDWARANPFTSWLIKVITSFISTLGGALGALFGLLQWLGARAPPPPQIITIHIPWRQSEKKQPEEQRVCEEPKKEI